MDAMNLYYLNKSDEQTQSEINTDFEMNKISSVVTNYTSSRIFTSKVHQFENFPEPRNATEGIIIQFLLIYIF
jgi:hypothetical protein